MFLTKTEYDRGVNTFSPDGRLFQVEYAIEATKLGSTGIGIKTKDGVILAVEKRINSPLIVTNSVEKIFKISDRIAAHHWFVYNSEMTTEDVTQAVSKLALAFGDDDADAGAMSRPFGVALMFAGYDEIGPQLFHMDPSGTYIQYEAKAIGSGSEGAQQALQEVFNRNLTLEEACVQALTILRQVMEEKLDATNVEMASVTRGGITIFDKGQLENVISQLKSVA
ncbi:subfamily T1A non peptidase ue [Echinococcus multilocularis]|uniref:Proteasome subunit alpha type n=1 Tax=Echinococcus multilocularis TaxID=6211 RepID=A0A068XYI5_ECHMU|nr:subfamily T1A non peptidase ue [Echinococcus multilocularis]